MKVRVLSEAETDAREAAAWYESRQSGLGRDFLAELATRLESIEQDPNTGSRLEVLTTTRDVRRVLFARFPYAIVYEIRPSETLVVAIWHTRRSPDYWLDRI
jgi:plasmid stabilization system protein ParE